MSEELSRARLESLASRLTGALPRMVTDLEALVLCESPSDDLAATARCAELVAALGADLLGAAPERLDRDGRAQLRWRFGSGDRVLLLGHLDTVWPIGTLERLPFALADGRITGPGCFDMKSGLVQMMHALSVLDDLDGVTVLVTSDEEIGSPTARPLIEEEARRSAAALVLEASADGALKTARKGGSFHRLHITGRPAHAGLEPERGANAAIELAHQILAIADLADPGVATTVTPTVSRAGRTTNTVPDEGSVAVDVRAFSEAEQQRVWDALGVLRPKVPGTSLRLEDIAKRPPLPPEASAALFDRASQIAEKLGLEPLRGIAVGGGSDGNLTAAVGTPTLDGLGAVGAGAHADDEHVIVAAMPERAALLAGLVADLLRHTV